MLENTDGCSLVTTALKLAAEDDPAAVDSVFPRVRTRVVQSERLSKDTEDNCFSPQLSDSSDDETSVSSQYALDTQICNDLQQFILRGGRPSFRAQQILRSKMQQNKDCVEETDSLT